MKHFPFLLSGFFAFFLLFFAQSIHAQVPAYVNPAGLVGWWGFNGNAQDASGNGFNGSVNGATLSNNRFGNAFSAYSYDGSNDRITVANAQALNPGQMTMSIWVRPQSFGPSEQYIVNKSFDPNPRHWSIRVNATGQLQVETRINNTYYSYSATGPAANLALNQWAFLCLIYDGNRTLLLHNQDTVINAAQSGSLTSSSHTLNFGFFPHSNMPPFGYFFNGQLDDAGMWNRPLNSCEVKRLYNATVLSNNTILSSTPYTPITRVVNSAGLVYNPDSISIIQGDPVQFQIGGSHDAREVSQATYTANGNAWNGGFQTAFGGGLVNLPNLGIYYYVCTPHASFGMKGRIFVQPYTGNQTPISICQGDSSQLLATGSQSYVWSNGKTGSNTYVKNTGVYYVVGFDQHGCPDTSATINVTVNPRPTATVAASGPLQFCSGGSVTLTASGGTSYLWNTGSTSAAIQVQTSSAFSVIATNANGCKDTSAVFTTQVFPNPIAQVQNLGPTSFCSGGSVQLLALGGPNVLWSNASTNDTLTVSQSGFFQATVTDTNGCSALSPSVQVSVFPLPNAQISASGPTTFCQGASVQLSATGGSSYLWSTGQTGASISVNTAGTYFAVASSNQGCQDSSNVVSITVNPLPQVSIQALGPLAFCPGQSVGMNAQGAQTYLWSNGQTGSNILVSQAGTFSATGTDAQGCQSVSNALTATLHPVPVAQIQVQGSLQFCPGDSVILLAQGGDVYLWNNGSISAQQVVQQTGVFSVIASNSFGCSDTSTTVSTQVVAAPTAQIVPSGPLAFCQGDSVVLQASGGTTYLWNNGSTNSSISVSQAGTWSVQAALGTGCVDTSQSIITQVFNLPSPQILASGPTSFCSGGQVVLLASGANSYLWSSGLIGDSIVVSSSGTFTLQGTDANGCSGTSGALTIAVFPLPVLTLSPSGPVSICLGDSLELSLQGGINYVWNDGLQAFSRYVQSPAAYWASGTDANGCSNLSDTATLSVFPLPQWVVQPQDSLVLVGTSVGFTAQVQGSNAVYQWQINRGNLWEMLLDTGTVGGSNTANLSLASVDSAWNGFRFRCIASLDGCSDTSELSILTVEIPVNGFGSVKELAWSIVRNPSGSNLQISGPEAEVRYRIFDFSGRLLLQGKDSGKGLSIDVGSLPLGCYLLELNSENQRWNARFCP